MKYRFLTEGKDGGKEVVEGVCRQRKAPGRIRKRGALWAPRCCSGSFSKHSLSSKGKDLTVEQHTLSQTIEKQCFVPVVCCTHRVQRAINVVLSARCVVCRRGCEIVHAKLNVQHSVLFDSRSVVYCTFAYSTRKDLKASVYK